VRLPRPLSLVILLYILAGVMEAALYFAKSRGTISLSQIDIVRKLVILISTLSTVILLRWVVSGTPFAFFRKYTAAPLLKTILTILIYLVAAITLLNQLFGIDLKPLLTGSAVLTAVLALSLQETIKNLFTGLWINTERLVAKGDWIRIADREGQVQEVTWRTTRILTRERDYIYYPNNMLAEGLLENFSHPNPVHVVEVNVGASYTAPPNKVKDILREVARDTPQILANPAPEVLVGSFSDSSISYRLRVGVDDFKKAAPVKSELYGRIWYAFRRNNVEIPFPIRTVYHRIEEKENIEEGVITSLKQMDIMRPLSDDQIGTVAAQTRIEVFGKNEPVVKQGDHGYTCYFIQRGKVDVMLRNGAGNERSIASLGPGEFFGEMSLLTGEPRKATVIAKEDCSCIVIPSDAFHVIFNENPDMAESLSELLAKRYSELKKAYKDLSESEKKAAHIAARNNILDRIKWFFNLREK